MARMIPETLNSEVLLDAKRRAEVKVYRMLQNRLGNDWTVFYSTHWLGKTYESNESPRDGEIDFIITNPKYGILIAEVKGGSPIEFDGFNCAWYTNNREGRHEIKDPYIQARQNKYALITFIKSWRGWANGIGNIALHYAVIFPDVSRVHGNLPLHAKGEITITEDDFTNLSKKVISVFEFNTGGRGCDEQKTRRLINDLIGNLAPSTTISRRLANQIIEEEEEIIKLTEQQYTILRAMQQVPRLSVSGCAGSGKTLLAKKKAQMSNESGSKTLLCCFSTLLGKDFNIFASENPGLIGCNFHTLIYSALQNEFSLRHNEIIKLQEDESGLIEMLLQKQLDQYDTIVIDEAQDFSNIQLEILDLFLKPRGCYYCFWDNNQKVIRSDFKLPANMIAYNLYTNFRNTEKIFQQLKPYYSNSEPIDNLGPEGKDVRICKAYQLTKVQDFKQKLTNEVLNLIHNEGISASNITILTFKGKEQSQLQDFKIAGVRISNFENLPMDDMLRIETVRRFKGLESQVVILTEMDEDLARNNEVVWNNLCYVGISRARNHLIILPSEEVADRFDKCGE